MNLNGHWEVGSIKIGDLLDVGGDEVAALRITVGFSREHLEGERCQLVPWEDWKEAGLREDQSSVYIWVRLH